MKLSILIFGLSIASPVIAETSSEVTTQALSSPALFWRQMKESVFISASTRRSIGKNVLQKRSLLKILMFGRNGRPLDRDIGSNLWMVFDATMDQPNTLNYATGLPFRLTEPHFFNQTELFQLFDLVLKGQQAYLHAYDLQPKYEVSVNVGKTTQMIPQTYLDAIFRQWNNSRLQKGLGEIQLVEVIGLETKKYPYYTLTRIVREGRDVSEIQLTPATQLPGFSFDLVISPPKISLHPLANNGHMPAATLDELYRSHFHRILKAFKAAFAAHDIRVSSLAKILNDRAVAIGQPYGLVWSKNIIIPIKFTAAQFLAETTFMTPAYPMITLHRIFLDPKTFQHLVIALIEELSYLIYGPVPDAQKFAFYAMVRQFGLEKLARLFREMDYGAPLGTGQIFARFIEHELIYRIAPYATPSEQAAYLEEHSHLIDQLYEIVDAYIAKNFPEVTLNAAMVDHAENCQKLCSAS